MKTKITYFKLFIFLTLLSCGQNQKEDAFLEGINVFNPKLIEHFPTTIPVQEERQFVLGYPAGSYAKGMAYAILSYKTDSIEIANALLYLQTKKINGLIPKDNAFIIIGDSLDYSKKSNAIPIPNFEICEKDYGPNSIRLTEYFKIYVIESEAGRFIEKRYLTDKNKVPENWKNGFSRGLAINDQEKEIIYWLCVW